MFLFKKTTLNQLFFISNNIEINTLKKNNALKTFIKKPYKNKSPFQFFLFSSKFFYLLLGKKVSFIVSKKKGAIETSFLLSLFKGDVFFFFFKHTILVGNFLNNLNFFSLKGLTSLIHFFFLNHSKKSVSSIFRLNQFIRRIFFDKFAKGFTFQQKGKLAWKALSRKKKDKIFSGRTAKTNFNLAASESNYSFFSNTGVVTFNSSVFFLFVLFYLFNSFY